MSGVIRRLNCICLFFVPIFFAIPSISINLSVINLRPDDLLIYLLFMLNFREIVKIGENYKPYIFYICHFLMTIMAVFSLFAVFFTGSSGVYMYHVVKFLGSIPVILILPALFKDLEYRETFYKGTQVAVFVFFGSLARNYFSNELYVDDDPDKASSGFKARFGSKNLNPNAAALYALLLGYITIEYYFWRKKLSSLIIGCLGAAVPFLIFARGFAMAAFIAVVTFVGLIRNNMKLKLAMVGTGFLAVVVIAILLLAGNPVVTAALSVDLESGKGLSHRDILWDQAKELIRWSKGMGYGFGTEWFLYEKYFDGLMSHMLYYHYIIELGIHSLIIFLISFAYLSFDRFFRYQKTMNPFYLMQFGLILGFLVSSLFDQLLYFSKQAFFIYIFLAIDAPPPDRPELKGGNYSLISDEPIPEPVLKEIVSRRF